MSVPLSNSQVLHVLKIVAHQSTMAHQLKIAGVMHYTVWEL